MEVGLSPGDFVFDGDPATPRTDGTPTTTEFLAHVYCGQMAGWTKMPLGTEVDLGPGHIVLDESQLCTKRAQQPPHLFGLCLLWPQSPISVTAELLLTYGLVTEATAYTDKVFRLVVTSHLTSWCDQNLSTGALLLSSSLLLSFVIIIIMHFLTCHVSVG